MHADPTRRRPAAILWDFDGTVGDTEPLWWRAEARFMQDLGVVESDEESRSRIGLSMEASIDQMLSRAGREDLDHAWCAAAVTAYVLELMREGVSYCPGVERILADAHEHQVPCALVSQSTHDVLTLGVSYLPAETFAVVVSGDQVAHPKPHPEPYLTAVERLGLQPTECLVIEDSASGLASAEAAGIPAVGVPTHQEVLPGERQRIVGSLERLTLDDLTTLWAELADA